MHFLLLVRYYPSSEDAWEVKPVDDPLRLDPNLHLCVDQTKPPVLIILGDDPTIMTQGSTYVELGVQVWRDELA